MTTLHGIEMVTLPNEVDFANVAEVREALVPPGEREEPLIVSLERTQYCDSTAISMLLAAHQKLGDRLALIVPPHSPLRRILKIAGLLDKLPIVESPSVALARLRAQERGRTR